MVDYNRTPYLRSVTLHDVHPFGSEVAFRFDPRVNVFVGPNGTGKSAALDRFAGEGRERFSHSTDESEVRVERIMEPESATFGDATTVYVGPTRAPLTPEMVLSDLHLLDIQGRVTVWLAWTRRVFLTVAALALAYLTVLMVANIFFDPEAWWFEIDNLLVAYVVFMLAAVSHQLASLFRRSPRLFNFLTGNWFLSNALRYRSRVSPIFMFQAVLAANRRWLRAEGDSDDDQRSRAVYAAANLVPFQSDLVG